MPDHSFTSSQIEALLRLARDLGRRRRQSASVTAAVLAVVRQLLVSRMVLLLEIHQNRPPTERRAVRVIRAIPATTPQAIENVRRRMLPFVAGIPARPASPCATVGADRRNGIWMLDELAPEDDGLRTEGTILAADWSNGSNGTRIILSACRSPLDDRFTSCDVAMLDLIRLACVDYDWQPAATLSRRVHQVLEAFQRGLSEKQCADELQLSRHTVHVYAKSLYKKFKVCSRGELLSTKLSNRRARIRTCNFRPQSPRPK